MKIYDTIFIALLNDGTEHYINEEMHIDANLQLTAKVLKSTKIQGDNTYFLYDAFNIKSFSTVALLFISSFRPYSKVIFLPPFLTNAEI